MRDPNRIQGFCNQFAQAWGLVPDMRFGQFIWCMFHDYQRNNLKDVFYVEDEKMLEFIKQYAKNNSPYYIPEEAK